jgi:hypothetical protein
MRIILQNRGAGKREIQEIENILCNYCLVAGKK